jgi:uncharacterized membrane protein YdjX (TVP38/TMEM64 family)
VIERLFALVQSWEGSGLVGLCVLTLLFVIGTLSYMPRFSLYLVGGIVFGFAAVPAAIIGSTIGATGAFLLARTVLRGPFERWIDGRPKWQAALAAINAEGWRLVALTRIAAPLPGSGLFAGAGALGRFVLTDVAQPWSQGIAFTAGAIVIAIGVTLILRRMRKMMTRS